MNLIYFGDIGLDDVLLYAMEGCYLMHVPTDSGLGEIHTAYIHETAIGLLSNESLLVIHLNPEVAEILKEQMSYKDAVLAVLIAPSMDDKMLSDLSFASFADFGLLAQRISESDYQVVLNYIANEREENESR